MKSNTRKLTLMGMLTALSIVLVYLIRWPIFPSAPFLEYDPADIPILIGTFALGPAGGILLTAVVSILQGFTVSAKIGIWGIVMHFFATGSFVLVAGFIYNKKKSVGRLLIGLVLGVLTMTLSMIAWNLIITPLFLGAPFKVVLDMILPVILPFNLIKAGINAIAAFILFNYIVKNIKIYN